MEHKIPRSPFKKTINDIPLESAHTGSGSRRLILSSKDDISSQIEAVTKGYLDPGKVFDWHKHVGIDELWIVTAGIWYIEYENWELFYYKAGDFLYNPAWLSHRIVAQWDICNEFFFIRVNY